MAAFAVNCFSPLWLATLAVNCNRLASAADPLDAAGESVVRDQLEG